MGLCGDTAWGESEPSPLPPDSPFMLRDVVVGVGVGAALKVEKACGGECRDTGGDSVGDWGAARVVRLMSCRV